METEQSNHYKVLCEHTDILSRKCGGETIITEKQYQWQEKVRCSKCHKLTTIDTDSEIISYKLE